ncbi:MAG TPA: histidine kinase [Mucilaginibacter sp.]|jgi:hypothetical protein|nr:histidine kinase [Mucilaginibacter sp.]
MSFSFSQLNYKQKGAIAEAAYLFVIGVLSPLAVGLQIFSNFSFTLSYVMLNTLTLPQVVLFYRFYLPQTIGKKRYLLFFLLFPVFMAVYELCDRLGMLALLYLPFVSSAYKNQNVRPAHPEHLFNPHFNELFGYTGLVLLAATSLYVIKLLFKNQHNLNTLENEKLKLELNQLKAQLQPHFFFNTINNMYSLAVQNSPQTPKMITDLSAIMRYILYEAGTERAPLQRELDFIKSYISLENMRHAESDGISLSVQGDVSGICIEPLLLLPIIENTFKHALHADMHDKWVRLVLAVDEDELVFQAVNPKGPQTGKTGENSSGIGLSNIRKRLELLYPGRHELVIHDEALTFTVILTIRLKA